MYVHTPAQYNDTIVRPYSYNNITEKDRLRLILPDPTAIRVGLSHASQRSNTWHTAQ